MYKPLKNARLDLDINPVLARMAAKQQQADRFGLIRNFGDILTRTDTGEQ
jgi:hypothetical protein